MLPPEFCDFLEYELTKAFANSNNTEIKNFWCDGVLLPSSEAEYSKKFVNDNRKVIMSAFIGPDGQDKYELTLNFGNKALSRYARDLSITDCVPANNYDWFDINTTERTISIQLD
ncbi:MAG: hypothetical protein WCF67_12760 [Chitinophagaceae bacterium]